MTTQKQLGAEETALLQEFGIPQTNLVHFGEAIVVTKDGHRKLTKSLGDTEYGLLRLLMLSHAPSEHHPIQHQGSVIHEVVYPMGRRSEKKRNVVVHYARYRRDSGSLRLVLVFNVQVTSDGPATGLISERSKAHHLIGILQDVAGQVPPDFFT